MKFMVIVKADKDSEAGAMPSPEVFAPEEFAGAAPQEVLDQEARLRAQGAKIG